MFSSFTMTAMPGAMDLIPKKIVGNLYICKVKILVAAI